MPLGALAIPGAIGHLIKTGEGSASIIMVLFAMLAGRSLPGCGRVWVRILAGTIGYALVPVLLISARTPQVAWASSLTAGRRAGRTVQLGAVERSCLDERSASR